MTSLIQSDRRILVLEDDEDIASALARGLKREGYQPLVAHNLSSAKATVAQSPLHAAVIDVMLGDEDGLHMVRHLRSMGVEAPIVMLSALSSVSERTAGLEAGADDYVAKPFDFSDVVARIQVQALRRAEQAEVKLTFETLELCLDTRHVTAGDQSVKLTERETLLLAELLRRPGRVHSRRNLFEAVWKDDCCSENVVDVYIGYLRRKLAPASDFGVQIETVRGRGFMLRTASKGEDNG